MRVAIVVSLATLAATLACAAWLPARPAPPVPREAVAAPGNASFLSPQFHPIALHAGKVYVVNTPAGTLDIVSQSTAKVEARIPVGVEPVCVAIRPDGKEAWVANHISDSVGVIDLDPAHPTFRTVVATVQEFDPRTRATRFDEPVGIAFASNDKAYVALSSSSTVAVIDVKSRSVSKRIAIPAQEPRAVVVRGNRLVVSAFESGNRTQLSGGAGKLDGDLATFDIWQHSIFNNNVLSLGAVVDIVKNPAVPDKDVFVFDTATDAPIATVEGVGTLLHGLDMDSRGRIFVAQTDARNDVNGRAGTRKHGLKQLENRPFLNRVTRIASDGGSAVQFDPEPLPPVAPKPGETLATPSAVAVSGDDRTLAVTAAGSDVMVTMDADTGAVLGRAAVGAVPQGVALQSGKGGVPEAAWVLGAADNTLSKIDLRRRDQPTRVAKIALEDPTDASFRRGRIAFSTARASSTGTFSCASCHPDGHTDQLLWVLDTPIVTGGNQIQPRSTMSIRGLRDTEPYHWDGIPGDPYGGSNSAHIDTSVPPTAERNDPLSAPRHLIDSGLASTMRLATDETRNDEGKSGRLSGRERDDMARFLLSVPHVPAPGRAYDDQLGAGARAGFRLFHIEGDLDPGKPEPNICGNCHRLPFLASTNTPGTGMDAPSWRGAQDRWLILPQGRLNVVALDFYRSIAERGAPEREIWRFSWGGRSRFDPVWDMVLEQSTGFSGALGRQATLDGRTARDAGTRALLDAIELAGAEGSVVVSAVGTVVVSRGGEPVSLRYRRVGGEGRYEPADGRGRSYGAIELRSMAANGFFTGTVTARPGPGSTASGAQPALWTRGPIEVQRGPQHFPLIYPGAEPMRVSARHLVPGAVLFVDGRKVAGGWRAEADRVLVHLAAVPEPGLHFLQVRNPDGRFSNEMPFTAARDAQSGGALLRDAVLCGDRALSRNLLAHGVSPDASDGDGNRPLHLAAFLGRAELVRDLLAAGANPVLRNRRREDPLGVASAPVDAGYATFVRQVASAEGFAVDLAELRKGRSEVAALLRAVSPATSVGALPAPARR